MAARIPLIDVMKGKIILFIGNHVMVPQWLFRRFQNFKRRFRMVFSGLHLINSFEPKRKFQIANSTLAKKTLV